MQRLSEITVDGVEWAGGIEARRLWVPLQVAGRGLRDGAAARFLNAREAA